MVQEDCIFFALHGCATDATRSYPLYVRPFSIFISILDSLPYFTKRYRAKRYFCFLYMFVYANVSKFVWRTTFLEIYGDTSKKHSRWKKLSPLQAFFLFFFPFTPDLSRKLLFSNIPSSNASWEFQVLTF